MQRANPAGAISRAGWLFADLFLVLAIVFLGSQGSVPTQRIWYLSPPIHVYFKIDSGGLITHSQESELALKSSLLSSPVGPLLREKLKIGLVITFAGGPGCDTSGAMATSESINILLARLFPLSANQSQAPPGPTQSQAYINLGCGGSNRADLQFFFWKTRTINR